MQTGDTLEDSVDVEARPPRAATIVVLGGRARPASFRLTRGYCSIGKARGCDIVIARPTVSRQHAEIALVTDGVVVRDLRSRNGTFYRGERIACVKLVRKSRLVIADVTIVIDLGAPVNGGDCPTRRRGAGGDGTLILARDEEEPP